MTYWQYLIKVGRRKKKIEKYFKSSCLRELKKIPKWLTKKMSFSKQPILKKKISVDQ